MAKEPVYVPLEVADGAPLVVTVEQLVTDNVFETVTFDDLERAGASSEILGAPLTKAIRRSRKP